MSLHKLIPESRADTTQSIDIAVPLYREWSLPHAIVKSRMLAHIEGKGPVFPIHREAKHAVKSDLQSLFDDFALLAGWQAQRFDDGLLLLDAPGVFAHLWGAKKSGYCSCGVEVWAESKARADEVLATVLKVIGTRLIEGPMFSLAWQFLAASGLKETSFEEICQEELHDEAYPQLGKPVRDFMDDYLSAKETVLVLLGPPGTGKTRLVRTILGEMSRRKGESAEIMYTCDKRALQGDEIFVDFITGSHDAFVVEDADHVLSPRADGNQHLHRFLAIADGLVRAQGRKIIFTTNLPNVGELDDALLRPGRCFAALHMRNLTPAEGARLVAKLCGDDEQRQERALREALPEGTRSCSVASVYRACA